ncbi:MAG: TatD family hydrolase [Pseudomonadales bacterium]|nr:TatD family hydrolase [Pseudomonadales bacterium]MBO6563934.1 TatD family hydrolase [Pseudomonadales bacterium]MBO6595939.1 TatD family hydrolase [Pseudomonadales bacterium]MBO6656805.1 TatD family hydrolase [Pseudomonadales bacterium]MBO6702544.1 TatD family hydrolase [Pseudomonadales bacterium]
MTALIDIGANLTHDSFDHDFDDVLERAAEVGVTRMVVTGASKAGSEQARDIAARHEFLFATAGIHPHHAEETDTSTLSLLRDLSKDEQVKAIGETGLDFFRDFSPRQTQITSFEQHIELAIETGLPMFLHERDAHPTFADVLRHYRDGLTRAVVHCFTGEKEALYAYLDLDCYIGMTGWICDERRGEHLKTLVRDIPDNRLMIETDAPYLMPRTIRPKPKTRRNEPMNLPEVCRVVADCREVSYEKLAQQTTENATTFFGLPA